MASSPMMRGSRTPATCELCGPSSSVGSGVLCHHQRPSNLWHGMVKRATLSGCGGSHKLPTQGILCQKISNFSLIHIMLSRSTRVADSTRHIALSLMNYGIGLQWDVESAERPNFMRQDPFVPCDCGNFFFA